MLIHRVIISSPSRNHFNLPPLLLGDDKFGMTILTPSLFPEIDPTHPDHSRTDRTIQLGYWQSTSLNDFNDTTSVFRYYKFGMTSLTSPLLTKVFRIDLNLGCAHRTFYITHRKISGFEKLNTIFRSFRDNKTTPAACTLTLITNTGTRRLDLNETGWTPMDTHIQQINTKTGVANIRIFYTVKGLDAGKPYDPAGSVTNYGTWYPPQWVKT